MVGGWRLGAASRPPSRDRRIVESGPSQSRNFAANGTDRPESDVDLLVEFEAGAEPGLLRLAEIETELSGLVGGRKVDLRTAQDLSRDFRDEVVRTAEVQYAVR
ncbi:MAG: nucleotidyltransferase domain-containing protein [Aliidongia sp.]